MGCCGSRESPPPLPIREVRHPSVDIIYQPAPTSPLDHRPALPARLATLEADQRAQLAAVEGPAQIAARDGPAPPIPPKIPHPPPKIPHPPPRPTPTELRDPERWQTVLPSVELEHDVPKVHLHRSKTSTLEYDPAPRRAPTPELESNPTPILVTSSSAPAGLDYGYFPGAGYQPPPPPPVPNLDLADLRASSLSPLSAMDLADLRARNLSPVSAMDPISRRPSYAVLEATGPHIELPANQEAGPHIELPAVPMGATVCGPVQMYHELDGGYGAIEMSAS